MEKIENPRIKEFLIKFASDTLEQCELFTQVFGKGFAYDRLMRNVKTVFTNEYTFTYRGYYNIINKNITLCTEYRDSAPLTVEELENNEIMLKTILHESVHAILRRNKKECKKFNINYGTGIFESLILKEGKDIEIGKGLNEGLTNWICYKAGYELDSYLNLTSLMHELEIAIGPERLMKVGRGDIRRNVARQFGMTNEEYIGFLTKADLIFELEQSNGMLTDFVRILQNKLKITEMKDIASKDIAFNEYISLRRNREYIEVFSGIEYNNYLYNNFLRDSDENRIKYLETIIRTNSEMVKELVLEEQSIIFDKYLRKEWEQLSKTKNPSLDDFLVFKNFSEIARSISGNSQETECSINEFLSQFDEYERQYFERKQQSIETDFKRGKLTLKRIQPLLDEISEIDQNQLINIVGNISQLMYPEDASAVQRLILYLQRNNQLQDFNRYSIRYSYIDNNTVALFYKDGKLEFTSEERYKQKEINPQDEVKEFTQAFDFTLYMTEDYKNIIREFGEIQKRVELEDPDAKIIITGRIIAVNFKENTELYYVDDSRILPAELSEQVKVEFKNGKKNTLPVDKERTSVFSKLISRIRGISIAYKNDKSQNSSHSDSNESEKSVETDEKTAEPGNKVAEFRARYKVEGEMGNTEPNGTNLESKNKQPIKQPQIQKGEGEVK